MSVRIEKIVTSNQLNAFKIKQLTELGLTVKKYYVSGYMIVQGTQEQFDKAYEAKLYLKAMHITQSDANGTVKSFVPKSAQAHETSGAFVKLFASKFTQAMVVLWPQNKMTRAVAKAYGDDAVICPMSLDPASEVLKIVKYAQNITDSKLMIMEVSNDKNYAIVKARRSDWLKICMNFSVMASANKLRLTKAKFCFVWETKDKVRPDTWWMIRDRKEEELLLKTLDYSWVKHDEGRYLVEPELEKAAADYADIQNALILRKKKGYTEDSSESYLSQLTQHLTYFTEILGS